MSGDAKRKENSTIKTEIIMLVLQVTGKIQFLWPLHVWNRQVQLLQQ